MTDAADLWLLRRTIDQLPALVAYWDVDRRNVVANHAYVDYFGLDPAQIRGRTIAEVLGPEVYAQNLPFITGVLAGVEQHFDRTLVDASGAVRHTQASYVPDVVDDVVRGFVVLVTDVTPRVEAQRAMDRAEVVAQLGSWELDVVSGAVRWSDNLRRIVGTDPEDPTPRSATAWARHVHPDDRDRTRGVVETAVRGGQPYALTYRMLRTDGAVREVVGTGRPMVGPDGAVVRIHGTLQDVTEVNVAARDLARVNLELRGANELNADVIAMLGHDLRSPLTAVLTRLEDLEDSWSTLDDEQRRTSVSRARAASQRLGTIAERILALASIDGGNIHPLRVELDLAEVLEDIVGESGLPGLASVEIDRVAIGTVSFDRAHVQQVIGNLLTNAFRYGAEPVRVLVTGVGDEVQIAVTDTGPGIPPQDVGSLFARFSRTGQRQQDVGGMGFGLYMAAQLAAANGATLSYRARDEGRPHAFVVTIPTAV